MTDCSDIDYSEIDDDKRLSTQQVAQWFEVSESFLNKARMTGRGPKFSKIGRSVRYRAGDCRKWLDDNTLTKTRDGASVGLICSWFDGGQANMQENIKRALLFG